jgi:hypothetical protein
VSGALLATGLVFGVLAINERSHFDGVNDGTRVQEAEDSRSNGKTLNLVADVPARASWAPESPLTSCSRGLPSSPFKSSMTM